MHAHGPRGLSIVALALLLAIAAPALASVESELAFHRGVIAYGEGDLDEAQHQFEIVLGEDAEDTVALHYLALIAQKRGDPAAALTFYDRALAIDPEDAEMVLDRGIVLLDAGRLPEARQAFARAVELAPDDARAHLFAGIAAYRSGAYAEAKPELELAGELDPTLTDKSRYYSGLSDAFLGNVEAAASAFGDAAGQSPLSPLGQSAQNFRQQLETPAQAERRWAASITAGMEYDSNPLILGDAFFIPNADPDGRGVVRLHGTYRLLQHEGATLTAGYDSYWSFHINETEVNLQTHNPWLSGGYDVGPVRLGLRYDYAFTFIDTTDPFRSLNRVTPSVALREGDWGVSYAYYQFHDQNFLRDLADPAVFDRDGTRNLGGFNQFFFLPEPFTYVRMGVLGDWTRTDGTEWSYNGVEATFGAGYDFEYDISFSWLFRFLYRHYRNPSALSDPPEIRDDFGYILTLDLAKQITDHWEVSLGAALTWNESDVPFYQYNRQVGGAYATYRF